MLSDAYKSLSQRYPRLTYYVTLTVAVCIAFAGVNAFLIASGREGIWTQDAQPLYANFLLWSCQALRQAFDGLLAGEGFVLPQFTYDMGYGADVPMTMGSYLQDPINIIVVLMPDELIGVSYPLMTLVRMILAAYAFSWYCIGRGHRRAYTGVAALAYATCGFIVFLGAMRHPKFIDWAITLPLILAGADRLFNRKGGALFAVALVLQFCISIYYSYMSCLVLLVYCLVKYFVCPRQRSVRDFFSLVARFVILGIGAFLVSALFSLPQIIALLSQGRATSGGTAVPLLFTIKYYAKIAAHFIGAAGTTDGMVLNGVTTIGLLSFLLCRKRFESSKYRAWLIGFVLCMLGVLIPYLGHIMNGMGYATDRWMLVLAFVCSYILCLALPHLSELDAQEWKRMRIAAIIIAAIVIVYGIAQIAMSDGLMGTVWPLAMAAVFLCVFAIVKKLQENPDCMRTAIACGTMVVVCASLTATLYCSPFGQNWGTTFPKIGTTWENISDNTPAAAMDQVEGDGLYRYTLPRVYNSMKNSPLTHGVMGIDYYTSFYNQAVDDFRQELGISDHHMNFSYIGSDSRLAIEDLTGAKYYICKDYDTWRVPFGFEDSGIKHRDFKVFENHDSAPLAYIASAVIPRDEYDALSMAQKQEALLQGAVVDTALLGDVIQPAKLDLSSAVIPYEVTATKGLTIEDGVVHVTKRNATMTLSFEGQKRCETYLSISGLSYSGYSPSKLKKLLGKEPTFKDNINDVFWSESTTYPITAKVGDRSKMSNPATPRHLRYGGKKDWVFNLGYQDSQVKSMTVTFENTGDYRFNEMNIVCQPVSPIVNRVRELKKASLQDLKLETNRMTANAVLDDDNPHLAVFTFAYSSGWSVTVDGQPARALKTNTAFLGVEVKGSGDHVIEWRYETPGVRTGAILSCVGLAAFIAAALVMHFFRPRKA